MKASKRVKVFFDASVILAGLRSVNGASGHLLKRCRERKIAGIISETVMDEILRNIDKIGVNKNTAINLVTESFIIQSAPNESKFGRYKRFVMDEGDIHLFVSAEQAKVDFLVSLDKKHVLILKEKVKKFTIVSPKELI